MADLPHLPAGLVILGSGGHASVLAEAASLSGWHIGGYLGPTSTPGSIPRLGGDEDIGRLANLGYDFALGLGFVNAAGAARRAGLLAHLRQLGVSLPVIRHPAAILSPSAMVAEGVLLAAGSLISAGAQIGAGAILNSGAIVDHCSLIGANTHVATGARLAGDVTVGDNVLLGIGCVLRQGVRVGAGAVIGAGAVVIRDVAAGATVYGCPAG